MRGENDSSDVVAQGSFFYGWIIVALCTTVLAVMAGILYSFGVFFKPLAADFGCNRAAISGIYSVLMVTQGIFALPMGWLADRFGPAKVIALCGFFIGLGLILTSFTKELWQLYLTYGLMVGIGISGGFSITTATTARWFFRRQGLALGIVSAGVGFGTLTMLPVAERLIAIFNWTKAYFIIGLTAWVVIVMSALFLRRDPEKMGYRPYGAKEQMPEPSINHIEETEHTALDAGISLRAAAHRKPLWMLVLIYFLFSFCIQMTIVHLVNYTTDLEIAPLMAATMVSVIGVGGVLGRLAMGTMADRIGSNNALIICSITLMTTLIWLILAKEVWTFYLFAVVFGFAYGGEVPQLPSLVGKFFGLQAISALVGTVYVGHAIGGALGPWAGGQIFDLTHSYQLSFVIALTASICAVTISIMLKGIKKPSPI